MTHYPYRDELKKTPRLTREKLLEKINLLPNHRDKAFLALSILIGPRVSEILEYNATIYRFQCSECHKEIRRTIPNKRHVCPSCKRKNKIEYMDYVGKYIMTGTPLTRDQVKFYWDKGYLLIINKRVIKRRDNYHYMLKVPINELELPFIRVLESYCATLDSTATLFPIKRCMMNRILNRIGLHTHYLRRWHTNALIEDYGLQAAEIKKQKGWKSITSFDKYDAENVEVAYRRMESIHPLAKVSSAYESTNDKT